MGGKHGLTPLAAVAGGLLAGTVGTSPAGAGTGITFWLLAKS